MQSNWSAMVAIRSEVCDDWEQGRGGKVIAVMSAEQYAQTGNTVVRRS